MRKYLLTFHTSMLSKLQYIGNLFGKVLLYIIVILMFTRLWPFIFSGKEVVSSYTLNQIIWYVAITELIWFSARCDYIRNEIAIDVKSGSIAYALSRPYNYIFYVLSKYFGEIIISLLINVLVAAIIGTLLIGKLETFSLTFVPVIAITFLLGILIMALVYISFALISFWFEENKPFIWIYEKFVLLLGIMFPIEIFPDWAQIYIKLTPIFTSIYAPAKMTVDFTILKWLELTAIQIVYIGFLFLVLNFILSRGVKKLYVNGG